LKDISAKSASKISDLESDNNLLKQSIKALEKVMVGFDKFEELKSKIHRAIVDV